MRPGTSDTSDGVRRTEALWHCLQSLNDFFKSLLSIPLETLSMMPFVLTTFVSFSLVTASRLLFLDDADWNVRQARRNLDFIGFTADMADRFAAAEQSEASQSINEARNRRKRKFVNDTQSMAGMYRDKIRWIRQWYMSKLPAEDVPLQHQHQHQQGPRDAAVLLQPMHSGDGGFMDIDGGDSALGPGDAADFDAVFWQALLNMDLPAEVNMSSIGQQQPRQLQEPPRGLVSEGPAQTSQPWFMSRHS